MSRKAKIFLSILFASIFFTYIRCAYSQISVNFDNPEKKLILRDVTSEDLRVGAERTEVYVPKLTGKRVAVCANHTSIVGKIHLVDTLRSLGINIVRIFAPEHGFRGEAEAGEHIKSGVDAMTGIPIVSLYGNHKKPSLEEIQDLDVIIFDIQDVGARFYTYISTLQYIMEAAAESRSVQVLVLDRPNPNGFWVDGKVLEPEYSSFVGMNRIPIAHGMTVGEYACMLNGEKWLKDSMKCMLRVVTVDHYDHSMRYQLPVPPSPNLTTMEAVYLYPTLCLFEGTPVSVGRGTDNAFCLVGYPDFQSGNVVFKPANIKGAVTNPLYLNKECRGYDLTDLSSNVLKNNNFIKLDILIEMYKAYPDKNNFFSSFFAKLAGSDELQHQIMEGKTFEEIRQSWQEDLEKFKKIRKKYLLYTDFE